MMIDALRGLTAMMLTMLSFVINQKYSWVCVHLAFRLSKQVEAGYISKRMLVNTLHW